MKMRPGSWRVSVVAALLLVLSSLGIGANATSGTHVKASGLWVEVSRSGYGTDCNYWASVGAYETDSGLDYVYYRIAYWAGSTFVWDSGGMDLPEVLSGGPGRVTMSVDAAELTAHIVLTPNGQYSTEMSGRTEDRDNFGAYVDAFTGHKTENSADASGTLVIASWEPPVCDESNEFRGWIGTQRGIHTYR